MAREVYEFDVTCPSGVTQANPQITNLTMPPRTIERITIKVPMGPRGAMGFALGMAGVPVIPRNAGGWIVTDNETLDWTLSGLPNSGAWQAFMYNVGQGQHTIYVRFLAELPWVAAQSGFAPLSPALLSSRG